MGMSASQARLVSLTARMSDVEYEGQQINQQRLALSNQMSDIYSQLQEMDVPTPPSPYSFYETNYSAKTTDGKEVYVTPQEDGTFSLQVPVEQDGLAATKNGDAYVGSRAVPEQAKDVPSGTGIDKAVEDYSNAKTAFDNISEPKSTDDKYKLFDQEGYDAACEKYDPNAEGSVMPDPADYTGVDETAFNADHEAWEEKKSDVAAKKDAIDTAKNDYKNEIKNHNPKFYKDAECKQAVDDSCFGQDGKLNTTLYSMTGSKQTVGGGVSYTVDEAIKKFDDDNNFNKLLTALDNHLRNELGQVNHDGWIITENNGQFKVYQESKGTDESGNTVTKYQEYGIETELTYSSSKDVTPEMGLDGKPVSIKDPATGKTLYLSDKTAVNQDAYTAANNEYIAKKAEYDHEQDRLNAETSKIQAQDKKLELKLKRLDTERNAINTEIDAVKKVIQDATEKGFKTFSG